MGEMTGHGLLSNHTHGFHSLAPPCGQLLCGLLELQPANHWVGLSSACGLGMYSSMPEHIGAACTSDLYLGWSGALWLAWGYAE